MGSSHPDDVDQLSVPAAPGPPDGTPEPDDWDDAWLPEWLGDEIIYVVDHGGRHDVRVRMPSTVRFATDDKVGLRHTGGAPAVYDVRTEELVA